ncbi:DUF5317 family protein [Hamadaea sp. NPDC051192]|uniref:DUF5317 family protein n=1 Tax=Hamadaea sp. NPDC051192 TaxID=3154940 RepID=UPI003438B8FC
MAHLLFVLSPLVAAALVGAALGRVPWRLTGLRLRATALLWVTAAVAVVRYTAPGWLPEPLRRAHGLWLACVVWALATIWFALNLRPATPVVRAGLCLMWTGFMLNAIAVAANGGAMPFAVDSGAAAGVGHVPLGPGHHLPWLTDVLVVPAFARVVSVGDLVLMAGITTLLVGAMARRHTAAGPDVPARPTGIRSPGRMEGDSYRPGR